MRQYLVLKSNQRLRDARQNFEELHRATADALRSLGAPPDLVDRLDDKHFEVVAAPSSSLRLTDSRLEPAEYVIAYDFVDVALLHRLRTFLISQDHCGEITGNAEAIVRNMGADPVIHFCSSVPVAWPQPFGNRSRVRNLMRIADLQEIGLLGRGVNVVILDRGLNREAIIAHRPESWGGGLIEADGVEPGAAPLTSHGMLIARNILDIAPEATLYDVPLLPEHISRPNVFASNANAKVRALIQEIKQRKEESGSNTAWILVNAWGVFDRAGEEPPGDYTANKHVEWSKPKPGQTSIKLGHPLNKAMSDAIDEGIDVIFGSGNCGQFSLSNRCGRLDRGPGNSIWGANAHPRVLTVGAVSANDAWMGYSSEGPAPWGEARKPDVCAPSHFTEDNDPSRINTGTSAATALASGVIAAIRSNSSAEWGPQTLPPEMLKAAINATARGQNGDWNARTGHGIIDCGRLLQQLAIE
jgi:hypothetical protein